MGCFEKPGPTSGPLKNENMYTESLVQMCDTRRSRCVDWLWHFGMLLTLLENLLSRAWSILDYTGLATLYLTLGRGEGSLMVG